MKKLKVEAPATIANLGPCFDVLGVALSEPFDVLELQLLPEESGVVIESVTGLNGVLISKDPKKNTAGLAADYLIKRLGVSVGLKINIVKGIRPASGMGSSGASAAGVVYGLAKLLERQVDYNILVESAAEGERAAASAPHADNVAACLMGGFVIVKSHHPMEFIRFEAPENLRFAVLLPEFELNTSLSRNVLPNSLEFKTAVSQMGSCAYLIAALIKGDLVKIGKAVNSDFIVEKVRAPLIKGFSEVKQAAISSGAYGCSISGGGPSIFAVCDSENVERVSEVMADKLRDLNIGFTKYVTSPSNEGVRIV